MWSYWHRTVPKAESFIVLRGHMVAMVFDDSGEVISGHILGPGPVPWARTRASHVQSCCARHRPGSRSRHTVAAPTPVAVCYEVKPGPWDPATDKEFAEWAPVEGSPGAAEYLKACCGLRRARLRDPVVAAQSTPSPIVK